MRKNRAYVHSSMIQHHNQVYARCAINVKFPRNKAMAYLKFLHNCNLPESNAHISTPPQQCRLELSCSCAFGCLSLIRSFVRLFAFLLLHHSWCRCCTFAATMRSIIVAMRLLYGIVCRACPWHRQNDTLCNLCMMNACVYGIKLCIFRPRMIISSLEKCITPDYSPDVMPLRATKMVFKRIQIVETESEEYSETAANE